MSSIRITKTLVILVLAITYGVIMSDQTHVAAQESTVEGQYASVNGLEMYYEIYGEGQPLILIHGGLGAIAEFGQLVPLLAETRQVIAVELQAHGRTADIDRPLSYENLADDVAALITELDYESADVMGFSLGGGVALQTAIRHPEVVNKLVLVSTPYSREGIHPEFLMSMEAMTAESADMMFETPMYQLYSAIAPNTDDWSTVVGKVGDMMRQNYDWSGDVALITAPTLILAGDSDMIPPSHAAALFALLGGGVAGDFAGLSASLLDILPGTTHFTILTRTEVLVPTITTFLDAPLATE
jgi:pimeloyl-ACP methyl ester carboxylesterase